MASASLMANVAIPWQYIMAYRPAGPAQLPSLRWLRNMLYDLTVLAIQMGMPRT